MRLGKLAVLVIAGLALLVGCEPEPFETAEPAYKRLSGTVTMAEYMSGRFASYDMFDEGIRSEANIPQKLTLYENGGSKGSTHDQDLICNMWKTLGDVKMNVDERVPKSSVSEEAFVSFMFDSGKEVIPFDFYMDGYAVFTGDDIFPIDSPDVVAEELRKLEAAVAKEMPKEGDELKEDGGAYFWDADGDGTLEHMWISVTDNGDEAPNCMTVRLFNDKYDLEEVINGAYGVESVRLEKDVEGPYVILVYPKGDFYSHDAKEQCEVRLRDGKLVVE